MIITIDKEAEKLLTELIDGYLKYTGLAGMKNVNILMQSLRPIPVAPVAKDIPEDKPVAELVKPSLTVKK